MSSSAPLRVDGSAEHILSCALHEADLSWSDLSPTAKKDFEKRIKADLLRQKQQPIVPHKLLKSTLLKKYAALMAHELGTRQLPASFNASTQEQHKPSVEKVLQRHVRERAAWDHVIQEDARSFAELQDRARRAKEEQVRIQRETLDIQLSAQRREREERKAQEVADLHAMLRQQKEDAAKAKQQLADQKQHQLSKRKEAESVSRDQMLARAREQEAARREEKRIAMELVENERRRKDEEAAKRHDTQVQIQRFVQENDAILRQKKKHDSPSNGGGGGALLPGSQIDNGRVSALPSGEQPPTGPEKAKKAESLMSRKDRAAQAYVEQQKKKEDRLHHLDKCRQLRLENERREDEERTAAQEAARLKSKEKYANDLAAQVQLKQRQNSIDAAADSRFRSEVELGVRYGALEDRKMKEEQLDSRHRNLTFLKAQLEAQRSLRSGFDVTPKIV